MSKPSLGVQTQFPLHPSKGETLKQALIFQPLIALFGLVFVVWFTMFLRHSIFLKKTGLEAQAIAMPEQVMAVFPDSVRLAGNNLRNLFELPVIFVAVCFCIYLTGTVDVFYLRAAWLYVGLRAAHSLIHCTINRVNARFLVWFVSCIVLWTLVARLGLSLF